MHLSNLPSLLSVSAALVVCAATADASATTYCTAAPNSVGGGAHIAWVGPFDAEQGALVVTGAPPSVPGVFVYSQTPARTPFGDGVLCVGGAVLRLARKPTDAQGAVLLPIGAEGEAEDVRWLNYPANAGVTWHFQYVHRDPNGPGGTGFNATDAVAVVFEP